MLMNALRLSRLKIKSSDMDRDPGEEEKKNEYKILNE
jgi:hypothetical protein